MLTFIERTAHIFLGLINIFFCCLKHHAFPHCYPGNAESNPSLSLDLINENMLSHITHNFNITIIIIIDDF